MRFFGAVCFTETPLSEVHCLDIEKRTVEWEPYGVVFLKDRLLIRGVSPVLYLNKTDGTMNSVATSLFTLIESHPDPGKPARPTVLLELVQRESREIEQQASRLWLHQGTAIFRAG
jgi:hypothetical protein